MKKYRVEIKEIYSCYVDVDAEDRDKAYAKVERRIVNGDLIVLDNYSYLDRTIKVQTHPAEIERRIRETGLVIDPNDR